MLPAAPFAHSELHALIYISISFFLSFCRFPRFVLEAFPLDCNRNTRCFRRSGFTGRAPSLSRVENSGQSRRRKSNPLLTWRLHTQPHCVRQLHHGYVFAARTAMVTGCKVNSISTFAASPPSRFRMQQPSVSVTHTATTTTTVSRSAATPAARGS